MTGCHSCVALQGLLCLGVSGHVSSGQTCSSRPIPRPHLALYLAQPARHQDPHICVSKGLFNLHGPSRQGAICRVHVFKRSCSHFSQVCHAEGTRARTDTKEGKTQANHGFVVVLAYFWQRSEAGVHTVFTNPTSQMIWFLASVGLGAAAASAAAALCCFAAGGWQRPVAAGLLALVGYYCWLATAG